MRQKSFFKDLFRSILKTKARFLSIMAIIALGVSFFAGINATEPDMLLSADQYYKDYNLSDFRLISPLGFKSEDIAKVQQINGVDKVQAGYTKDVFLTSTEGNTATVRIFSYDANDHANQNGLNRPVLTAGRLPEKSGEIAIERGRMNVPDDILIGSEIKISLPNGDLVSDSLKTDTYTVVGRINSPLYINFERGQTNIGDGSIGFYAYIAETDFAMEKVTDLFVRTAESQSLMAYSEAYQNHLTPIESDLKKLGEDTMARETQSLQDELNTGKAELQTSKETAERELADGEKKLQDAAQAIIDGEKELQDNETRYTKEFADQRILLKKGRTDLEKGKKLYSDNYARWLEGYNTYKDGTRQLSAVKVQLDDAKGQITQGEKDLAATKTQLDSAKRQLDQLQLVIAGLKGIRSTLPVGPTMTESEFNLTVASIRIYSPQLADNILQDYRFDDLNLVLKLSQTLDLSIAQMEAAYLDSSTTYDAGLAQYTTGAALLAGNVAKYEAGLAEYQAGLTKLNASKIQIDSGKLALDKAKATLDESEEKIITGEAALAKGEVDFKQELVDGHQKIVDAKIDVAEGRATYETEKADALQKIADAEVKIRDSERIIVEIPHQWFVLARDGNPGYSGYGDDARRVGAVAKAFPLFFFLVAALVCLTTMTRMVEEERVQIGTLKALGYSTLMISSKYLLYALLASLVGATVGLVVGFRLFPGIIMNAYGIMYQIPVRLTPDHPNYAVISICIAVVTTVTASLLATLQELRTTPAVLMQPKAPKPGKRIFLERIRPIWKRLSFSSKVTARNIFRYKQRFLMTVIGIAGCTALLLTGFGLRDSVNAIMGKQFAEIFVYDAQMVVNTEKSQAERDVSQILGEHPEVKAYLNLLNETVSVLATGSSRTYEATILVPEDAKALPAFYDLHERVSKMKIPLSADGAVVTEKLANMLHVKTGDTITYRDSESRTYAIKVASIAENYFSHFIYLSPEYFDKITFRTPEFNTAVFNVENAAAIDQKAFKEKLLSHEGVLGAMFTISIAKEFNDTIKSLNFIVLILILSAGALAFVVLYNLTNINITERIREIATIKVLGFRDREVSAYVYRENVILAFIGTFVGLLLGFFMHRFVMGTMEIDNMMFGKDILPFSYIWSIVLTMTFAVLVNIFMYYHLRKINMVESLKSVE